MRNGGVAASAATNSTYNARRAGGGGGIVDDGGFQTGDDAPRPVNRADKAPPKIGALLRAHLLSCERPWLAWPGPGRVHHLVHPFERRHSKTKEQKTTSIID